MQIVTKHESHLCSYRPDPDGGKFDRGVWVATRDKMAEVELLDIELDARAEPNDWDRPSDFFIELISAGSLVEIVMRYPDGEYIKSVSALVRIANVEQGIDGLPRYYGWLCSSEQSHEQAYRIGPFAARHIGAICGTDLDHDDAGDD